METLQLIKIYHHSGTAFEASLQERASKMNTDSAQSRWDEFEKMLR